jgi:hypothetical protein
MFKEDNLKEELEKLIAKFMKESYRHKKLYRRFRYVALVLTALATVLSSVALTNLDIRDFLNIAIVIATASAGVITSIEGLRKFLELWIHERNTLYKLIDLQREINYNAASTGSMENIDDYFARLQQILGSSQEKWTGTVSAKKHNGA